MEATENEDGHEADEEEELPPFAVWLRAARRKKGWKQGELARKAGLSGQQISNLETGRSRNPQSATVEKLRAALGTGPDQKILDAEVKDTEIPGIGSLVSFDPYAEAALPPVKGVYVFYDKTKRPVYVGRATKRPISERVPEHTEKFWFRPPVVASAFYLEITNEELCKQTEQVLIKFLRTHLLLNKQGVETEPDDVNG